MKNLMEFQSFSDLKLELFKLFKPISGTYKNKCPDDEGMTLELRVDVDANRPQEIISGDIFKQVNLFPIPWPFEQFNTGKFNFSITRYQYSFIVEDITETVENGEAVITGQIHYFNEPTITNETIEVRIKRQLIWDKNVAIRYPFDTNIFSKSSKTPPATVKFLKNNIVQKTYLCKKTSKYFRQVTLEIDRFEGTEFPANVSTDIEPSPDDLPTQTMSMRQAFLNSGINMTVNHDDVLNDADSNDTGSNWDEGELHDLMEDRFDQYSDRLQWNLYGVVVPRFGDPGYNSGYYGTMFDWGGWQAGDSYLRQGCAMAYDATFGRESGTLYDTDEKKERFFLETFVHEVGHSFNLPHSWSRSVAGDSASDSYMNYPWGYTGGTGGEQQFWENFRWQFDDVELAWMRHQDRNDVIFGGNDWIGNNLSVYLDPQTNASEGPLQLEINAAPVMSYAEPVRLEIKLTNISSTSQFVVNRLDPEDSLLTLFIQKPNGDIVRYVPPVLRLKSPGDIVELAAGENIQTSILVSFGAKGYQFEAPGAYTLRAYYGHDMDTGLISKALRLRVAAPSSLQDEELAHMMFDRNIAKFIYFNGTERYPQVTSQLEEAVLKYKETNPQVVRHINAALGLHATRDFKQVKVKDGKRIIMTRKSRLGDAITHLQNAISVSPNTAGSSIDNNRLTRLSEQLSACQMNNGYEEEAAKTLKQCREYLAKCHADEGLIRDFELGTKSSTSKPTRRKSKASSSK